MEHTDDLPYCANCPVRDLLEANPLLQLGEPLRHVADYIENVIDKKDNRAATAPSAADLNEITDADPANEVTDKDVKLTDASMLLDDALEAKESIDAYLDAAPVNTSRSELRALHSCARRFVMGYCVITGSVPGYVEQSKLTSQS